MKGQNRVRATLTALCAFFDAASIASLLLMAVLVFMQMALRNLASLSFAWIDELARYLQVSLVYLMVPVLFRRGQHLVMETFVNLLPPRLRGIMGSFCVLLTAVFSAGFMLSWRELMLKTWSVQTPALGMPNAIFFLTAALGMVLLFLAALEKLFIARGEKS